jgi:uncharacterized protein (DUF488 family)
MRVLTVGHSTRTLEELVEILRAHGAGTVVDVRRIPASRRHPHFARAVLERELGAAGLGYRWMEALGGRRSRRPGSPHVAWRVAAFAGYADHMDTEEFAVAARALLALAGAAGNAGAAPPAVLCAEALPWECHRRVLADWLVANGATVEHLIDEQRREPHAPPAFARFEAGRVVYDGPTLPLFPPG